MKKKITAVLLLAGMLSACAVGEAQVTDSVTETITMAETIVFSETSAADETEVESATETVTETTPPEETATEAPAPETLPYTFYDFRLTNDYPKNYDIGGLEEKAKQFILDSDIYDSAQSIIYELEEPELNQFIGEGWKLITMFGGAYTEDFDGDGKEESFIIIDLPHDDPDMQLIAHHVIFADSDENLSYMDTFYGDMHTSCLIDYGGFKHIAIGGSHITAMDHSAIFSVENGKATEHYDMTCYFVKQDCFVSASGRRRDGDMLFYDEKSDKYLAVKNEEIPYETIKEMDSTNVVISLLDSAEQYDGYFYEGYPKVYLVGQTYYVAVFHIEDSGTAVFTYENGEFVEHKGTNVRIEGSESSSIIGVEYVDINIAEALKNMKPIN